jgi:hypothetical protein
MENNAYEITPRPAPATPAPVEWTDEGLGRLFADLEALPDAPVEGDEWKEGR